MDLVKRGFVYDDYSRLEKEGGATEERPQRIAEPISDQNYREIVVPRIPDMEVPPGKSDDKYDDYNVMHENRGRSILSR
jgi:hypothetical protein